MLTISTAVPIVLYQSCGVTVPICGDTSVETPLGWLIFELSQSIQRSMPQTKELGSCQDISRASLLQIRDEANEQLFGSGFSAFLATLSLIGLPKEEHAVIQSCSVGHLREGKGICLALEVLKRSAKAAEETLPCSQECPTLRA